MLELGENMGDDNKLKLRRSLATDLDTLAIIWFESASLPGVGPEHIPSVPELRERMDREIEAGWHVTVAEDESGIVGFLAIRRDKALLDQLFLRPDAIGKGIGRELFDEATRLMPQGFALHTAATNGHARRFYEMSDMSIDREELHPRFGHPIVWYTWPSSSGGN
jgi:GNAT superfamily N-acetyltransferase